jgi:Effector Associated Constant Component 1
MPGGDMEARISILGGDPAELESLHGWLCREHTLAGRVKFAGPAPRSDELGAWADALVVAVSSGGAVSVLAGSLKAWVSLPRRSDVRIRVQGVDGRVAEITADRVSEERADALIRQALGFGTPEE